MNENIKNWIVPAVVIIVATIVGAVFFSQDVVQTIKEQVGAVSSPYAMGDTICSNGLCSVVVSGSNKTATSTIVDFRSPLPATSTIELMVMKNTGVATTTYGFHCGPTTASTSLALSANVMAVGLISTSTNFGVITNGIATTTSNSVYGTVDGSVSSGRNVKLSGSGNPDTLGRFVCVAEVPSIYSDYNFATTTVNSSYGFDWKVKLNYQQ